MPIMDGYTAAKAIRTQQPFCIDPRIRELPIIAMTARAYPSIHESSVESGMNDGMLKPIRLLDLKRVIQRWSKWEVVQDPTRGPAHFSRVPIWGPLPFRRYRGPRSLL